jgi:hypothetical protein
VDIILGSDILYALPGQPEFFSELAATLDMLLSKPSAIAIFAYQHRSGIEKRYKNIKHTVVYLPIMLGYK